MAGGFLDVLGRFSSSIAADKVFYMISFRGETLSCLTYGSYKSYTPVLMCCLKCSLEWDVIGGKAQSITPRPKLAPVGAAATRLCPARALKLTQLGPALVPKHQPLSPCKSTSEMRPRLTTGVLVLSSIFRSLPRPAYCLRNCVV